MRIDYRIRYYVHYEHHCRLMLGEDGATHRQILEDIGMMRMLPGMTVIGPCGYNQTKAVVQAIAEHHGPVYALAVSAGRSDLHLNEGKDVFIFATGHLVWNAVEAARELEPKALALT